MRNIEFRAKVKYPARLRNRQWEHAEGDWVRGELHVRTIDPHIHYDIGKRIPIDMETVGQNTGMRDTKGKDIWEGDIIEAMCIMANPNLGKTCKASVFYDDELAAFCLRHPDGKHGGTLHGNKDNAVLKVIGNIYDNPELLK